MFKLLSRDQFRETVFKRDSYKCLVCNSPAKDAHHIIERRLFPDSGYYLENGASVCEKCHIEAEQTLISCSQLRELAGITKFPIPSHLYPDQEYDKWGNIILPNNMRLQGELFNDPSVQKILQPVLHLFTNRVKYARTFHLPWSESISNDDRVLSSLDNFKNKEVIVSIKMDGENTTFYSDYLHARSIEYKPHPSRSWIKAFHSQIAHEIPKGWRVCGENLYAKHSIKYENLEHYFQVFSIWNDQNICLSWSDTIEWAKLLNLSIVPIIYQGIWDEKIIRNLYTPHFDNNECEGYVVRVADQFHYKNFKDNIGKYVRNNHISTHNHWLNKAIEVNGMKK